MKVSEIAELIGGTVEGDADAEIDGAADLAGASASEIAFVEDLPAADVSASRAGCLIVSEEALPAHPRTLIRVARPRNAFARAATALHPLRRPPPGVHPTAVVAASARLGEGVSIGPQAVIGERAVIGRDTVIGAAASVGDDSALGAECRIHSGARIYERVRIGDRAIVHSGAVVGADGFGFVFEQGRCEKFPQLGGVSIGDDVEIGANSCVDRGALGDTAIGDGVKLDNLVHIGHNCRLGNHVVIAAQTGLSGGVIVEDYVVMGGQVGVGEKAHIGARATLGGQAGVLPSKTVAAGGTYWGTPARPHREYLRRLAAVNRLPKLLKELEETIRKLREPEES